MADLTDHELARYEWQIDTPGFGPERQQLLKDATVLVSRVGGVGSVVAYELAAAGIGNLILAHGGNIKPSDLNRQLLMTHEALGTPRIESIEKRLKDLNPHINLSCVNANINSDNAEELVKQADVVVDCAPLFEERILMNKYVVKYNKILVEAAMYDMDAQVTTIVPGKTPCLNCLFPEIPPAWKRKFPVFGATSGTIACMGALEAIKCISNYGDTLAGKLLLCNFHDMEFTKVKIKRDPQCPVCKHIS